MKTVFVTFVVKSLSEPAAQLRLAALATAMAVVSACGDGSHPARSATPTATTTPLPQASPFPIAVGLPPGIDVDSAWGSDRYLVTFSEASAGARQDVVGVRLTQNGTVIDGAPFVLSDFGREPFLPADAQYSSGGIAFAGDAFGVFLFGAGSDPHSAAAQVIGFVSVPRVGAPVLPATAIDRSTSDMADTTLRSPITVTSNGRLFLGVYQRIVSLEASLSLSQVFAQILTLSDGGVVAQPVGPLSGMVPPVGGVMTSGSAPGVAINPAVTLIAWVETSADEQSPADVSTHVQGLYLTPQSANSVRISDTEAGSQNTAVASDGTEFLVVWTAATAGNPARLSELRAIRVSTDGRAEPPGGFLVAGGSGAKTLGGVVFAGGVYLVAWMEDGILRGARLQPDSDEAALFTVDSGPDASMALASDGERFLVVFNRLDGTSSSDVLGTFLPIE